MNRTIFNFKQLENKSVEVVRIGEETENSYLGICKALERLLGWI